jgi:hypothetical protein
VVPASRKQLPISVPKAGTRTAPPTWPRPPLTEDSRLVIEPTEAAVVRAIFAAVIAHTPYGQIVRDLNARRVPASRLGRGKRRTVTESWSVEAVSRIIRTQMYSGRASYFRSSTTREVVHRDVPAIITTATFLAARKSASQNRRFGGAYAIHAYALRGLVACGKCGYTMIGRPWGKRHGFYCHRCPLGSRGFIDEQKLIEIAWTDLLDFLAHPDATLRAIARSATEVGTAEQQLDGELMSISQQLRDLEDQEARLLELNLAKTISAGVLERKADSIRRERERLKLRSQAVRDERVAAIRSGEESASIRRLLGRLSALAQRDDVDRVELIRTATRGVTFHARTRKVQMRYAFSAPVPGSRREASSPSPRRRAPPAPGAG